MDTIQEDILGPVLPPDINTDSIDSIYIDGKKVARILIDGGVFYDNLPYSLTLSADKTFATAGDTINLTATCLNKQGDGCKNKTVEFINSDTEEVLGTAVTNSSGLATVSYSVKDTNSLNIKAKSNNIESNNVELLIALFYPQLNGNDSITSWTSMTNKTENGIFYTHGSFLTEGWSNEGLWKLDFDIMCPRWTYVGLMPVCSSEINPYTDAKNNLYSMTTWEGITYLSGMGGTVVSEDTMSKITSTNTWHHITIEKLTDTQCKITINNTYHSIRNFSHLPEFSTLHIGSRDNPASRNYGGIIQLKNIIVKSI